jgi:transcriptional regulator with XRE-family HTH domain
MGIGENIRMFRKEDGYTQKQLALIIGVKATYISALERGLRRPGKKILPRLCDALGVDEMTVLFGPREVYDRGSKQVDYSISPDATPDLSKRQLRAVRQFVIS